MGRKVLMLEQGGRDTFAAYTTNLARALVAEGADVTVATASDHEYPTDAGFDVVGPFYYLRGGTPLRDAMRRLKLHKVVNAVAYLLAHLRLVGRMRRADVVHVQGFDFPPLVCTGFAIIRAVGARLVHTPHNTFDRGAQFPAFRRLMWALSTRIVVHARWDLTQLPPAARDKSDVIPHGNYPYEPATPAERAAARADLGAGDGTVVALVYGQLRPDKGVGDVVAAAREVEGVHVVLAGGDHGALGAAREGIAALGPRITVREGFQSDAASEALFAASDVVVLAYSVASASGVLLTAYSYGRPVVVYPVGGLPEAVEEGETGWICARADVAALADAFADAAEVGEAELVRRGRQAHAAAVGVYGWPAIARKTLAVYASAVARTRRNA